ncbi:MAG: hypothetical protein UY50_C0032G0009, partial [Parcubacteria group bacterium GW2011_GWA2_49_9]
GRWDSGKIVRILMNEAYAGTRIYNKTWGKLHQRKRQNPRSAWIVCPRAFPAIVSPGLFSEAQRRLRWILPSRRRKGQLLLRKVEKRIIMELVSWIHAHGVTGNVRHFPARCRKDVPVRTPREFVESLRPR